MECSVYNKATKGEVVMAFASAKITVFTPPLQLFDGCLLTSRDAFGLVEYQTLILKNTQCQYAGSEPIWETIENVIQGG